VRRDIWNLEEEQPWHPVTLAYARAVGQMQTRPPSDPTSWTYQAQVHGMPGFQQPDDFRGQCQHNSWFFLPWHRLYLYWFERIVRSCVDTDPEADDETRHTWALPYWNYSPGGTRATLPASFREETMPDGSPNPLFVAERNQFINDGEELDERAVRIREALLPGIFDVDRPDGGFGGAATGWNHLDQDANAWPGSLEQTPHGDVHVEVGGPMAGFDTAGFDPVFWLHHANIDRLWASWNEELGQPNPDAGSSWGTTAFGFHDEKGGEVPGTAAEVLDTVTGLGYRYEDITVPDTARRRRRGGMEPPREPAEAPAELVGATEEAVRLAGGNADVTFRIGRPSGPAGRRGAGEPERVILAVEGIAALESGTTPDVTYAVYVNLPEDVPDDEAEDFYAGNVNFFGIAEATAEDSDAPPHELRRSFDITELVEGLRADNRWDPDAFTVSFRPLGRGRGRRRGPAGEERATAPVRVGRVGLYVQ
jgi:tyrosinase